MIKLDKAYDASKVEADIYQTWLDSGYFNPDNLPGDRPESYTIMIAPPNITGTLHMGHALENTISDLLIRYHRMQGKKTLWLPGTDHAGIATQNVVEKDLKKQGLSRHDLGKEQFIAKVWEWKEKYGDLILDQLKKLGCSLDWSRMRFTMDQDYQEAVKVAFDHYRKQGLIYQGERVINWCIKDQTALSDLELEYEEETSKLWYIKYQIKDDVARRGANSENDSHKFITVATTRPETMLGDTAVAVNPKDKRYAKIIGQTVLLPIINREIPIVADHTVDMDFGTGAVKVTPAHDLSDSDIAERNQLPYLKVINEVGKIINVSAEFDGLKIAEAREKVVDQLQTLGLLEKEQDFTHNVAKCYRCGSTVEPMLSKQWFMKMKPLAEKALSAIKAGQVSYSPKRWEKIAVNWLENVRDWCISRQIWWGHPIPIEGSEDTFDTWFSSALWPFATLGWPKHTADLKTFYPTQTITSARDILHLWISRMIFSGLEFTEVSPFKNVIIHATVLTKDGKRMSKSLGTGIDPIGLMEKYGTDAMRFGLIYQASGGQDIRFNEDVLLMGKKFANKLWNISRYVLSKVSAEKFAELAAHTTRLDSNTLINPDNQRFVEKLRAIELAMTTKIEKYSFGEAAHVLYDFVWHDFADQYIELSKTMDSKESQTILADSLITTLKLLHPFMPFITEAIWSKLNQPELLLISKWPE